MQCLTGIYYINTWFDIHTQIYLVFANFICCCALWAKILKKQFRNNVVFSSKAKINLFCNFLEWSLGKSLILAFQANSVLYQQFCFFPVLALSVYLCRYKKYISIGNKFTIVQWFNTFINVIGLYRFFYNNKCHKRKSSLTEVAKWKNGAKKGRLNSKKAVFIEVFFVELL